MIFKDSNGLHYPEWKYGRGGEIGSFEEFKEWKPAGLIVFGRDCPQCGHKCSAHFEGRDPGCGYMHPFKGLCPCGIGGRQAKMMAGLDPVPKFRYERATPGQFSVSYD